MGTATLFPILCLVPIFLISVPRTRSSIPVPLFSNIQTEVNKILSLGFLSLEQEIGRCLTKVFIEAL